MSPWLTAKTAEPATAPLKTPSPFTNAASMKARKKTSSAKGAATPMIVKLAQRTGPSPSDSNGSAGGNKNSAPPAVTAPT